VALEVARSLDPAECLVIGGLAVMAHGFVRATRDVDLLTRLPLTEARRRLADSGVETRMLKGDFFEGGFSCLQGALGGVPFDVLPELVPIHWELATPLLGTAQAPLRLVALVDLLALKLKAQGPKDLMDAAMLVLLHPETRESTRELAVAYGVADKLDMWLTDPRLARQAKDEAERERRRAGAPKRKPRPRR
jgi:hypothetical protein